MGESKGIHQGENIMSKRTKLIIGFVTIGIGIIPGLFIVGVAVFADGPPIISSQRLSPVIGVYLVLGFIFGIISKRWRTGVWLSLPALLIVFTLGSDIGLIFQSLYCVAVLVPACSSAFVGALLTRQWNHG